MDFLVEKNISQLIENQFPQFYKEEGPAFIQFVKAYYEWMESNNVLRDSSNNVIINDYGVALKPPIHEARNLLENRDIDTTLDQFLEFFQRKYLYGIPFNVIINKRYLLKHILDVYRSKGNLQSYKLLFRLIYDEDIEMYLPSQDVLRVSDGKWTVPTWIEISKTENLDSLRGKTVIGMTSGTTAIVENYIKEYFNKSEVNCLYISNVLPKGGVFTIGEKLLLENQFSNSSAILSAPVVLGSLDTVDITNGGQNFQVGDILKAVHRDPLTNEYISYGTGGLLKVLGIKKGYGQLDIQVADGGFGYLANSLTFVYPSANDTPTLNASFKVQSIIDQQKILYYNDVIADYANTLLNATTFNMPGNTSANVSTVIIDTLKSTNGIFGSIYTLTSIFTGNGYSNPANTFVRSTLKTNALWGNVSFNTATNSITGTSTTFSTVFNKDDIICLRANSFITSGDEYHVIKQVVNDTSIILYDKPHSNSTSSAEYRAAPTILPASYNYNHPIMQNSANVIYGENERISAYPSRGNGVITTVKSLNSGKGYLENEEVILYLHNGLSDPIVVLGGLNYSNGELIDFFGGEPRTKATGSILTDSNGSIVSVSMTNMGSGYKYLPEAIIQTTNGTGAKLYFEIAEFNTFSQVRGNIVKRSIGTGLGKWENTDGFLNDDKVIQDSYYYQDYSYEIKVNLALETYRDILYNTFHVSGTELFGSYLKVSTENSNISLLSETSIANTSLAITVITVDTNLYKADVSNNEIACDVY